MLFRSNQILDEKEGKRHLCLILHFLACSFQPRLHIWSPAQCTGIHVNHTTSADCSGRSNSQVLHLKQHVHGIVELDPLTVGQTQHLIVIQHCVHVLNPQSIHRPITHNPFVIFTCILWKTERYSIKDIKIRETFISKVTKQN